MDQSETGPFLDSPIEHQISLLRGWLNQGNRPEQHYAVRPHTVSPPPDTTFDILTRVSVQASWKERDAIQCNVCKIRFKFLREGYVASYGDGWWYIIGPDCGSALYADYEANFTRALNALRQREAREAAEGRIREFLDQLEKWGQLFATLRSPVEISDRATRSLAGNMPSLVLQLDTARKNDGWLTIDREQWVTNRFGNRQKERLPLRHTRVAGAAAIVRPNGAVANYKKANELIGPYFREPEVLDRVILESQEQGTQETLRNRIGDGLEAIESVRRDILEAQVFWQKSNLVAISAWSQHHESGCNHPFKPKFNDDTKLVYVSEHDEEVTFDLAGLLAFSKT